MATNICIAGGTGFIGRNLTLMLKQKGYNVTIISRNMQSSKDKNVKFMLWTDVNNSGLPPCQAVVNVAGELLMNPFRTWDRTFKQEVHTSRVETTQTLTDAINAMEKPPKALICASAIGYYKPSSTAVYTEDSSGGDFDFLSQMVTDWEKSSEHLNEEKTRRVIVRIGIALGRDGGVINDMILPFFLCVGGPLASGKQYFPWVHIKDVAGIMTHSIENNDVSGILNAVAPQIATNEEFTQAFAKAMWRPAFLRVPEFALNYIFGAERAEVITKGAQIKPKRTLKSGYRFIYPDLKSACKEFAHFTQNIEMYLGENRKSKLN